jgi:hypothetical protein
MASYSWYTIGHDLKPFVPANVTNDMLALSDEYIWPDGYTNDFNRDGRFDVAETQTDAAWLVKWVRGFRQPDTGMKKEWLLGPVNHSVPALMVPPGYPRWLYGTEVTDAERERFIDFQKAHQTRQSVCLSVPAMGCCTLLMQALFVMATTRTHPVSKKIAAIFCGKKKMKPARSTAKTSAVPNAPITAPAVSCGPSYRPT